MRERILFTTKVILRIFVRKVLLYAVVIAVLVGLSFLLTRGFSAVAFSERLVWTGLGTALIGGFLIFGQTVGGRNYGLSGLFTRTVHANDLINFNIEVRQNLEKKFDFTIQLFFVGLILFLLGVLVDQLFV